MTEASGASGGFFEVIDDVECHSPNGYEYQLCNAIAGFDYYIAFATVPDGHHQLSLVVRIDQTDQVAQHDPLFMAEARPGQNHGSQFRIGNMDRDSGWDELRFPRLDADVLIGAGAKIHPGSAIGRVFGQGVLVSYPLI
jgi:hypothetical protein